jgi:uncharacterized coiled-coil DUF342 family protein
MNLNKKLMIHMKVHEKNEQIKRYKNNMIKVKTKLDDVYS